MSKKHDKDSYSHILKYTSLFGGVQGLGILVGIIRNKLIAVILGPQGMGLVSLFNSTIKLVSDSTNFGISMSAVKNISEEYDRGNHELIARSVAIVRLWSLLAALLGTFLCVILSPLLSRFTFSWDGHTLHFVCLSPIVGLLAITGGELAILKGLRKLRGLATVSIYNVLSALLISVPIYYVFGQQGIVPSLLLMVLAQTIVTIAYSCKQFPYRVYFNKDLLGSGFDMIKLGVAFVVAGMLGSGADFLIRSYLNNVGQIETVGLYNAGFMMTMTYVGMVFSAMETDYFPRLSGVNNLGVTFNETVNRQIEVMLLLVSPLLVAFMIALPILLPLLYSGKFLPALGMMQVVVLVMYFRALKLPVQYIPLAKGDSRSYLLLEAIYDILLVALVVVLFHYKGLTGAGVAILIAGVTDFVVVFIYARWRYGYRPSHRVMIYTLYQLPFGLLAYVLTFVAQPVLYWLGGIALTLVSVWVSLAILRNKSDLQQGLLAKIKSKFLHQ